MKTETGSKTPKNHRLWFFVVLSSLLTSGEKADRLWLQLKPLGIKKLDQTRRLNTSNPLTPHKFYHGHQYLTLVFSAQKSSPLQFFGPKKQD